jgi:hypothetical protein
MYKSIKSVSAYDLFMANEIEEITSITTNSEGFDKILGGFKN